MPCLGLPSSSAKGQHCCGPDISGLTSVNNEIQETAEGRELLFVFTEAYIGLHCWISSPKTSPQAVSTRHTPPLSRYAGMTELLPPGAEHQWLSCNLPKQM